MLAPCPNDCARFSNPETPTISNNIITCTADTMCVSYGIAVDAMDYDTDAYPVIENNVVSGFWFGILCSRGTFTVVNNLCYNNTTGIQCDNGNGIIADNTVADNDMGVNFGFWAPSGGGVYTISNNIVAFNTTWGLWKGDYTADPILSNNDIYNPGVQSISNNITYTVGVDGNIESDPLFMNASESNYHLQTGSPCIDAGDVSVVQPGETDLDGHPRIIGGHVDIGAYEYDNPGVTISPASGQAVPAASSPINFTVTFTQIVTGFTSAGVTLSGTASATTTTVTDSGDHMNYSVGVTGMANNGTVILSVDAGAAHNSYGDPNAPSSYTIVYQGFATSTIYVDTAGTGDGSSWTNAAPTITDGLSIANMGDQVWVEVGTYAENVTVPDGVALYGGFAGGETSLSQRNVRANVTTISDSAGAGRVHEHEHGRRHCRRVHHHDKLPGDLLHGHGQRHHLQQRRRAEQRAGGNLFLLLFAGEYSRQLDFRRFVGGHLLSRFRGHGREQPGHRLRQRHVSQR